MVRNAITNVYEFIYTHKEYYPEFFDVKELLKYAMDDKMIVIKKSDAIIGFTVLDGTQMKALYIAPEHRFYSRFYIPMFYKKCKNRSDLLTVAVDFNNSKSINRALRNEFKPTGKIVQGKDRPLEVYEWRR